MSDVSTGRNCYAVFYITVPGESDSEGLFVARSKVDALRQFRKATGEPKDSEWEAHRLSAWQGKAWCEGYFESICDAEERREAAARLQASRKDLYAKKRAR